MAPRRRQGTGLVRPVAYNPLDKLNLGRSIEQAVLERDLVALPPPEPFAGAGVYVIYYLGELECYAPLPEIEIGPIPTRCKPIYAGKAVPKGARKGGLREDAEVGPVLFRRLVEHAKSIEEAENLAVEDFRCQYLVVDDIWIPLGESLIIEEFAPLWNTVVDGFGNHDPGRGRRNQARSDWDTLHPGREWAARLRPGARSVEDLERLIDGYATRGDDE